MTEQRPTVRARELGEALRAAMEKAGVTGKEVARELQWSQSEVSRMLSGKRGVKESDVATLLGYCRIGGAEHKRLLKLCEEANKPGWWQQLGPHAPAAMRTFETQLTRASSLHAHGDILINGLLQTEDYARAVISSSANNPPGAIEPRLAARMARSKILTESRPPSLTCYLDECALRRPVGGNPTASDQLHHLLRSSTAPAKTPVRTDRLGGNLNITCTA